VAIAAELYSIDRPVERVAAGMLAPIISCTSVDRLLRLL